MGELRGDLVGIPGIAEASRALVHADGDIGAPEVGVERIEAGDAGRVLCADAHGEDPDLIPVGEGVERGDRPDIIDIAHDIGIENDGRGGGLGNRGEEGRGGRREEAGSGG